MGTVFIPAKLKKQLQIGSAWVTGKMKLLLVNLHGKNWQLKLTLSVMGGPHWAMTASIALSSKTPA